MRASVDALRFIGNINDCRYIRNVHTANTPDEQPNTRTSELTTASDAIKLPKIDQSIQNVSQDNISHEIAYNEEQPQIEPAILTDHEDIKKEATSQARNDGEGQAKEFEESLSSSSSTLAEMFEQIRNTRYLRMPGPSRRNDDDADDDDDDDDEAIDVCMMSHGYNTPLIIVGHTKAILLNGNTFDN